MGISLILGIGPFFRGDVYALRQDGSASSSLQHWQGTIAMIIWGTRGREKTVDYGSFHCPSCRGSAPYEQRRVSTYFTLYFIPLFPISTQGEYIQCGQCNGAYDTALLNITPEQIAALTAPWRCDCGNNNPADYGECLACGLVRALEEKPVEAQVYE